MNKLSRNFNVKPIVICGSMSSYKEMLDCQKLLEKENIPSIVPQKEIFFEFDDHISCQEKIKRKQVLSRKHFQEICDASVFAVLVVNPTKNQIKNYIGANTFAEIAVAFCYYRRVFILYDIYDKFKDELIAWETQPLRGNINKLVDEYYLNVSKKVAL